MAGHDHELTELLGLLQDQKPEVRRLAAEAVLSQTEDTDFLDFCKREPRKCARPLLRLAEKAELDSAEAVAKGGYGGRGSSEKSEKIAAAQAMSTLAAGVASLKSLVNLSAVPALAEELVALNAPKRLTEALRAGWLEGRAEMAHWYAMLLANVSTSKKGQEALCGDEGMLKFLVAAYLTKPRLPPRDGYEDPLLWLGAILVNVLVLPEGRKLLAAKSQELEMLFREMSDRARRADMVSAAKNVCLDMECHEVVTETDLMLHMARFLCPWEKMDAESRAALPGALRESLEKEGATLTGDLAVRSAAAACGMGLCRSLKGREYLRSFVQVFRSWMQEETDASVKDQLDVIMPAVLLSEDELKVEQEKLAEQNSQAA